MARSSSPRGGAIRDVERRTKGDPGMNLGLSPIDAQADQRFLIHGVDWDTYEKFLAAVGDRHIFLTYDGHSLEFMMPSPAHERYKRGLDRIIDIAAEEADIAITGLGMTTLRREDLPRGLEADECYYTKHLSAILGKTELDLIRDPPPDLAIEIDITSSSLRRQAVYAALKIPEIWRYDGEALRFYCLGRDGEYTLQARSPTFPFLDPVEVHALVQQSLNLDNASYKRAVRTSIREQLARAAKKTKRGRRNKTNGSK